MAKNKLIIEYDYDFSLYGIVSPAKDYRLAWLINKQLGLHLKKEEDIELSFLNEKKLVISNYLFATQHAQLRLLKNRSEERPDGKLAFLIPELRRFDFLVMKNGSIDDLDDQKWLQQMQKIKEIQYFVPLEIDKLKSRENLIF